MGLDQKKLPLAFLIINGSEIYFCTKALIKIGRSSNNDLILSYPQISRDHAILVFRDGQFEIEDLNSTGGTLVNSNQISKCKISRGDVITLADVHLIFGQDTAHEDISEYQTPQENGQSDIKTQSFGNT